MGEIIKRFESKKNSVFLVSVEGIMQVVKVHESEEKAYFESEVLKRLYLYANVPKVIKVESNRIYMEYIEGKLAVDYFLECDTEEVKELARQMLSFCRVYSDQFDNFRLSDTNFRNFIVVEMDEEIELYGVDFEEREEGTLIKSAAELCAFSFLYDVDAYKKKTFYNTIASNCSEQEVDFLNDYIFNSLNKLIKRRRLNLNVKSVFEELVIGNGHMV
ncbi:MAG TPA: hypothetical protein PLI11_01225 [Clostridia bacterium]|nr:hypothetical protein [Clostridiaceae bacterium]HOA30355.1 hypothetical protein [Clostridia bacterium]HPZ51516.1 hypothetical protein [Clostridia bacterium]